MSRTMNSRGLFRLLTDMRNNGEHLSHMYTYTSIISAFGITKKHFVIYDKSNLSAKSPARTERPREAQFASTDRAPLVSTLTESSSSSVSPGISRARWSVTGCHSGTQTTVLPDSNKPAGQNNKVLFCVRATLLSAAARLKQKPLYSSSTCYSPHNLTEANRQ